MTRARRRRPAHWQPRHASPSLLAPTRGSIIATSVGTVVAVVIAGCALASRGHEPPRFAAAAEVLHGAEPPPVTAHTSSPATVAVPVQGSFGDGWLFGGPGFTAVRVQGPPGASGVLLGGDGVLRGDSGPDLAANGIPTTALSAYRRAATREAGLRPTCGLRWPLLAAIGRVESNHGRYAGAVLHADGLSTPRIVGIPLNGVGTEVVRDTDHGRLDGDRIFDRAVGPMQFIPSTWAAFGVDANSDGIRDPNNIFDAAAAAADYLCAAGRDLTTYAGQVRAVGSYNHSDAYIAMVLNLERSYDRGISTVPTAPGHGSAGPVGRAPRLPPVDPGRPRGVEPKPQPPPGEPTSAAPSPTAPTPSTPAPATPDQPTPTTPSPSTSPPSPDPSTSTPAPDPSPSGTPTPADPSGEPSATCYPQDPQPGATPVDDGSEQPPSSVPAAPTAAGPGDDSRDNGEGDVAELGPCEPLPSVPEMPKPIPSVRE
ncbi:MAG: lytic murein transglycosylase [Jatrophihabitans sp.]